MKTMKTIYITTAEKAMRIRTYSTDNQRKKLPAEKHWKETELTDKQKNTKCHGLY